MNLKREHFDKNIKCCRTCKFIDEYTLNISDDGKVPYSYDGTAICCKFNKNKKETIENRCFIHPCWEPCSKYEMCTKRQADYIDIFDPKSQTIINNPNK